MWWGVFGAGAVCGACVVQGFIIGGGALLQGVPLCGGEIQCVCVRVCVLDVSLLAGG